MSRLKALGELGQSVWLDTLTREMIQDGELGRLIATDGISGMTSNPAIFEKAIGGSREYDADIKRHVEAGEDVGTVFRHLAVHDIRMAADALRPVYDATMAGDGFISMEVSPYLADDTKGTVEEALSLWAEIDRANLMIKVPATQAGLPAIRALIGRGVNVNVTLLFSCEVYEAVAGAYIAGLEMLPAEADLSRVASVASFFVSRIDSKIDALIEKRLESSTKPDGLALLRGKVAVANAKEAYQRYKNIFAGPRWAKLAARGARPQRLLWASTGTKNKAYSDVLYVDTLIGPGTVNTMPPETMDAFRDHGTPTATIEDGIAEARQVLAALGDSGISLDAVTADLVEDGVEKFAEAADKLYGALAAKRLKLLDGAIAKVSETPGPCAEILKAEIEAWTKAGNIRRLWNRDPALWTGSGEDKWLGWLDIAQRERDGQAQLKAFASAIQAAGVTDVVLLGMGGSSLGAAVLSDSFGHRQGWPRLHVLDSTDPDQIRAVETAIALETARFIVSSKSGTTLEPNILKDYFWARVGDLKGARAGEHFIAITDPGSALERNAREEDFAHIFHGDPAIGGRYSVLSGFGLVPAAAMGLDTERFLAEAGHMVLSCGPLVPPNRNPGVRLGLTLGALATRCGRDKITIVADEALATMGTWLEQLIAESTGKHGKGLIPVDREPLGGPDAYGEDRVFVHLRLAGVDHASETLAALEERGHPVIRIVIEDSYQLGQLFFLWEIATAVAGSVLGIDPFDQPDVEAAKVKSRELTAQFEKTGALPPSTPIFEADCVALFADAANRAALGSQKTLTGYLKAHLGRLKAGDYFALLAFVAQSEALEEPLQAMRTNVRDAKKNATCLGFGPRFLHSTGQAYKGGPGSGVFLAITAEPDADLDIPGRRISFGTVERAQALGDIAVLNERGRRVVHAHLTKRERGLAALRAALASALE